MTDNIKVNIPELESCIEKLGGLAFNENEIWCAAEGRTTAGETARAMSRAHPAEKGREKRRRAGQCVQRLPWRGKAGL